MKTISIKAIKLLSLRDKSLGKLKYSDDIFFKTRFGIHTFGMKKIIDVIVLDNKFKVVSIKKIPPRRFYFWNIKYNNILETDEGKYKISPGDKIDLLYQNTIAAKISEL